MKSNVENTSIVCAIRNRNEILADSLKNWIRFPVPEILLVDFRDDSCQRVWDVVQSMGDPRIKLFETVHEYHFHRTAALNLGISNVKTPYVLKLDADYLLRSDFFEINSIDEQSFLAGSETKKEWYLDGLLLVSKKNFDRSGGYHERLFYYGYEDKEIGKRLEKFTVRTRARDRSIRHKPHPDSLRLADLGVFSGEKEYPLLETQMTLNRLIAEGSPWSDRSPAIQWRLEPTYGQVVIATRCFNRQR